MSVSSLTHCPVHKGTRSTPSLDIPSSSPLPPKLSPPVQVREICMCRSSRCQCNISNMPATPYLGNVDLPTTSPYPSPMWGYQQLPAVGAYNHYPNPYPTPPPTLPGTPNRLPITPNSPLASLPSSPRFHIDTSLMYGHYDASADNSVMSDRSLLNPAVDQSTFSLVLVLPYDLNAGDIVVTPTTSSPYVTTFDVVTAIRKALYASPQRRGDSSRRRLVDSLRGRTRISLRGMQPGSRPVLSVEFS